MTRQQDHKPYNPLEKRRLAESIVHALLEQPRESLPPDQAFEGAGIYAIYFEGDFALYRPICSTEYPIYVGKANPPGSRKGGFGLEASPGKVLYQRLKQHAKSSKQANNLQLIEFSCRYLVVDDIWISLAESLLIEKYLPIWNTIIEGFGIHDPGKGRAKQKKSVWDQLHPGRAFAHSLPPSGFSLNEIRR